MGKSPEITSCRTCPLGLLCVNSITGGWLLGYRQIPGKVAMTCRHCGAVALFQHGRRMVNRSAPRIANFKKGLVVGCKLMRGSYDCLECAEKARAK